jgi:hypothetical protein
MNAIKTHAGAAMMMLILASCAGTPAKESEWNAVGLWKRVGNNPPSYVPAGYSANRARTEREGRWFVDRRDGKRLFVPGAVEGELLTGEAMKVTGIKRKKSPQTALEDGTSSFLYGVLMTAAAMGGAGGGGGYGGGCHR